MAVWGMLFPGQGAQYVGMGKALADAYPVVRLTFQEADDALEYALSRTIFEGPDTSLEETEIQQPAILAVSVAIWRLLRQERPRFEPKLAMGLSLGEYSAYVASGALPFADALRVTRIRGRAMQEAVPLGVGGMMAVLGLSAPEVEAICLEASTSGEVNPANFNAPGQIVISGRVEGLEAAETLIREAGGRARRLRVSAPFHSSLLKPAEGRLQDALKEVQIQQGSFPVVANVDGALCVDPGDLVPRLIAQVSRPVRFELGVREALRHGVESFLELGPGRSLSSLVKKIDRSRESLAIEDPEGLGKALELL